MDTLDRALRHKRTRKEAFADWTLLILAWLAFAGAILMYVASAKGDNGKYLFKYQGAHTANGAMVFAPMMPADLGVQVLNGGPPKQGEVLNCEMIRKEVEPHVTSVVLACNGNTYLVTELLLER